MKRLLLLSFAVALLNAAGCGESSVTQPAAEVLPDGPNDPRAYTEEFLSQHPNAVLRPGLMAILTLESTHSTEDTGTQEGVDSVTYQFDAATELDLTIDPSADRVGALVLRDARGRQEAHVPGGTSHVSLGRGRHILEVHHIDAGDPTAPTQTVFIQPVTATHAGLRVSGDCVGQHFDQSTLTNQNFNGINLSGSTFDLASITNCTFVGADISNTTWVAAGVDDSQFTNAVGHQAYFGSYAAVNTGFLSCDFRGADLTGAYFDHSTVSQSTFGDADPSQAANLTNTSWATRADACFITNLELTDFRNVNLSGARFLGTNISGCDFSGASLAGANLTGGTDACTLVTPSIPEVTTCDVNCVVGVEPTSGRTTDFSNAVLASTEGPSVQFQTQKLSGVTMTGAHLAGGDFDGYDLSGSDLSGADLTGTHLNGADLHGATLSADTLLTSVQLNGAILDDVDLQGLNFTSAQLNSVSFFERDLHDIDLSQAQLVGANLDYTDLTGATLSGATLGVPSGSTTPPASLDGAYMPNADLSYADLRNVSLSYAHLYGDSTRSNFTGAVLDGAKLDHSICSGSRFTMASMVSTDFSKAQLVNCSFDGADLTDASFDTAYLQGADFSGAARVGGASLVNAAVATAAGSWTYTEQNGMPVIYSFGPTMLGAFASLTNVYCPDGNNGPCSGSKLTPIKGPFPPQPTCIPTPPAYNNCPEATPTPTPPPLAVPGQGTN